MPGQWLGTGIPAHGAPASGRRRPCAASPGPNPGRPSRSATAPRCGVWQKATGLWQPDPGEPPNLVRANFTGIAFDPAHPSRGYAVGKQGVLLGYGRPWNQEALPPGVPAEANFTSIAFAGEEALATYKFPIDPATAAAYAAASSSTAAPAGGSTKRAEAALAGAVPAAGRRAARRRRRDRPLSAAKGVSAGEGAVIEREGAGAPWQRAAGGSPGYPAALAAIREGGQVRAIVSVVPPGITASQAEAKTWSSTANRSSKTSRRPGQAPLLTDPYPLPGAGLVLRQTATGWRDEQHQAFPLPASRSKGRPLYDLPVRPDPVLALLLSPDGSQGWAVGGETGTFVQFQRGDDADRRGDALRGRGGAARQRLGGADPERTAGTATFALGGNAQCAGPCADLQRHRDRPRPLAAQAAVNAPRRMPGMRAFLYTGPGRRLAAKERPRRNPDPRGLRPRGGCLCAALGPARRCRPSPRRRKPTSIVPARSARLRGGIRRLRGAARVAVPGPGITPLSQASGSQGYYSFDSGGSGGTVRVIVLDYSASALGRTAALLARAAALRSRRSRRAGDRRRRARPRRPRPQRGLGRRRRSSRSSSAAALPGCAACRALPPLPRPTSSTTQKPTAHYSLTSGGRSIPAFGSGTLGYVTPPPRTRNRIRRRQRLPDRLGQRQRPRPDDQRRAGQHAADPRHRLARPRRDRRHPAAPQPARRCSKRSPAARWRESRCPGTAAPAGCELQSPEPYVPIPTECQGQRTARPGSSPNTPSPPRSPTSPTSSRQTPARPTRATSTSSKASRCSIPTRACSAPSTPARPR